MTVENLIFLSNFLCVYKKKLTFVNDDEELDSGTKSFFSLVVLYIITFENQTCISLKESQRDAIKIMKPYP